MKRVILTLGFMAIATSAQAITVGNLELNTYGMSNFIGKNDIMNKTAGLFGQLSSRINATLQFTYLGKEAGNTNSLLLNGLKIANSATNMVSKNDSFLLNVSAGVVDFGFTGTGGLSAANTTNPDMNITFIENVDLMKDSAGNPFAFLAGFNDGGSNDADYDDYVVGISEISAIPVPAALPLMASALGAFAIARRRNSAHSI